MSGLDKMGLTGLKLRLQRCADFYEKGYFGQETRFGKELLEGFCGGFEGGWGLLRV